MQIESSSLALSNKSRYSESESHSRNVDVWRNNNTLIPQDILTLSENTRNSFSTESLESSRVLDEEDALSPKDKMTRRLLEHLFEELLGKKVDLSPKSTQTHSTNSLPSTLQGETNQNSGGLGWGISIDDVYERSESSTLSFEAQGSIRTQDGREVELSLEVNLSHTIYERSELHLRAGDALFKDPLVIEYEGSASTLGETKFSFDIDSDGESDQISTLSKGVGFIALDTNENGKVDNGNELFGATSGSGFEDLSLYDDDQNGWIDENDAVFDKLRIWIKNDEEDRLIGLGEMGIGALYLDSSKGEYNLYDQEGLEGKIRSSGLFLRKDLTAGSLRQIDLIV